MEAVTLGPIFFLTGPPGVGKSSLSRALAQRFEKGVHIDVDYIRLNVVKGLRLPEPGIWTDEHTLQFNLAHITAAKQAQTYAEHGFAVVVEHCSHTQYIDAFRLHAPTAKVVSLTVQLEANQERNAQRTSGSFDYPSLGPIIEMLNNSMREEHSQAGYPLLDTTDMTIDDSVNAILALTK